MTQQQAQLKQAAKDLALIKHRNDSDDQLRNTVLSNSQIVLRLPNTEAGIIEMLQRNGESEGCNEILKEREAKKNQKKNAFSSWKENAEMRKEEALLRLEASATPEGQLIAAILEDEDALTAKELHAWCEELSAMDEPAFEKLLETLVAKEILDKNEDGTYLLRIVCTEDPKWTPKAAEKFIAKKGFQNAKLMNALLDVISLKKEPCSAKDCAAFLVSLGDELLDEYYKLKESEISVQKCNSALARLKIIGIVQLVYSEDMGTYYDFAYIGEGRNKK